MPLLPYIRGEWRTIIPPSFTNRSSVISVQSDNLAQWSTFWQQGFITTFGSSKPDNYDGVVLEFWQEKFVELENGSRILDIAAGNGAIATIAAEVGADLNRDFFVAATDLAEIHAELIGSDTTRAARSGIEFHSGIPCEIQPFDDDSFDMVTSQFGFEYSDVKKTLREVRRVLVPGGRFVAISHHADSLLIEAARLELDIYRLALDEFDLVGGTRRYFEAREESAEKAKEISEEVSAKVNDLLARYGEHECAKFIVGIIRVVAQTAQQTTLEERRDALQKAEADLAFARARLDDMVEAALDGDQAELLAVTAREAGFESVHCLKLYVEDGGLAGWQIHLR